MVAYVRGRLDDAERYGLQQRDLVYLQRHVEDAIKLEHEDQIPADHPSSLYRRALLGRLKWHIRQSRQTRAWRDEPPVSDADEPAGHIAADLRARRQIVAQYERVRELRTEFADDSAMSWNLRPRLDAYEDAVAELGNALGWGRHDRLRR